MIHEASRKEIETAVKSTIGFIRGIICCAIERGIQLDEFDGALSRPELVDKIMGILEDDGA